MAGIGVSKDVSFDGHTSESVTDGVLAQVSNFVAEYEGLRSEMAEAEDKLKYLKGRINQILQREIPALLENSGVQKLTTADGTTVQVKDAVKASIKKGNRAEALAWLRDNGHGDVIKTFTSASFPAGKEDRAKHLFESILAAYPDASPELKQDVPSNTLSALVREQLEGGIDVPMALLGAHILKTTKVSH